MPDQPLRPRPLSHVLSRALALAAATLPLTLHADIPPVRLVPVVEAAFPSPVAITHAGDGSGRLFVTDQRGTVHIVTSTGDLLPTPFLDISANLVPERRGFDERGLLSTAFHPDYPSNGRFYVYYSAPSPDAPGTDENPVDHRSVISEFQVDPANPDLADPASERILLTFDQPQFNHDGGQLAFGPDGLLYISTGDGGSSNDNDAGHTGGSDAQPDGALGNAQDLTKLLGKILRIDPLGNSAPGGQYSIPPTNPFAAPDDNARDEIFAYGLRNPWRFSFDRANGTLYAADVGQGDLEEINIITAGANYGWRNLEGTLVFDANAPGDVSGAIGPIAQYAHPNSDLPTLPDVLKIGTSITGGYVYRGTANPGLVGTYLFGDWTSSFSNPSGTLLALAPTADPDQFDVAIVPVEGGNPIGFFLPAFGEDEAGELYLAGKTTLAPSALDPATGQPTGGLFRIEEIQPPSGTSDTLTITPSADATLYEDGNFANGTGANLFSGHTASPNNGLERRALLKFDIAGSVPGGATIDSATVSIRMNKNPRSGDRPASFGLHRILQDWGEGTVNAGGQEGTGGTATTGSATWVSTAINIGPNWTTQGGDFEPTPSASVNIASINQTYDWTSPALATDVQNWLENPATNFGWMLYADSDEPATARRFDAREASTASRRPTLAIGFTLPGFPLSHRETFLNTYFGGDPGIDNLADGDADSLNELFEYAYATAPDSPDDPTGFFRVLFDPGTASASATFTRDPRTTDLTYELEFSTDLATWVTAATSANGEPPTPAANASASEKNLLGHYPAKAVTVTVPTGSTVIYFRLRLTLEPLAVP